MVRLRGDAKRKQTKALPRMPNRCHRIPATPVTRPPTKRCRIRHGQVMIPAQDAAQQAIAMTDIGRYRKTVYASVYDYACCIPSCLRFPRYNSPRSIRRQDADVKIRLCREEPPMFDSQG